ncbi:uncharacterized protein Dana_GF26699 [Drosophila ananassae]|uniref:DUF753 domain-containing protein n=1 Tax=Drosophila ananassae TaxID=7217 RepID=A0A0P8XV96_DROAN|nr:uncharacterized protein LOC26514108 [Drosophila ananassae]KPU78688.1 uncharacterized protein Dana_GF26699 [Drosophila ananassae]
MWKISLFLILIGTTLSGCQPNSFLNEMECADCSEVNKKCMVYQSGWSCNYEFDEKRLMNSSEALGASHLGVCLPKGVGFAKEKAIFGFCCFWSPEMGCQKLRRKAIEIGSGGHDECYQCSRSTWSSLMDSETCPCGKWLFDFTLDKASSLKGHRLTEQILKVLFFLLLRFHQSC